MRPSKRKAHFSCMPSLLSSLQSQVQVGIYGSSQLTMNWQFPGPPSSGWINFLEQPAKLRNSLLTRCWFIIRECNSQTALWKTWGQSMVEDVKRFNAQHPPSTPMCSPTQKLSKPRPFGFLWRFHYIDITDQIFGYQWLTKPPNPLSFQRRYSLKGRVSILLIISTMPSRNIYFIKITLKTGESHLLTFKKDHSFY